jgi:hypothetical protein
MIVDKIKQILETLETNKTNWKEIETRRDLFQFNHYMRFFDVVDIDKELFKNKKYKMINLVPDGIVEEISKNFLEGIETKYDGYIGKCYFVKLLAQRYPSRQYYEIEEYEDVVSQVCIPIATNDKNSFCIDDKIIYPSPGDQLFIGNDSLFAVYNLGETDIIYLCVDIIPKKHFQ